MCHSTKQKLYGLPFPSAGTYLIELLQLLKLSHQCRAHHLVATKSIYSVVNYTKNTSTCHHSALKFEACFSINAITNGSACSVLFLSTTGLFPARRKILEHETQSRALMFFLVLETTLKCSKTVLNTVNHCLLRLDNSHK